MILIKKYKKFNKYNNTKTWYKEKIKQLFQRMNNIRIFMNKTLKIKHLTFS